MALPFTNATSLTVVKTASGTTNPVQSWRSSSALIFLFAKMNIDICPSKYFSQLHWIRYAQQHHATPCGVSDVSVVPNLV